MSEVGVAQMERAALSLLRKLTGDDGAVFRRHQLEAASRMGVRAATINSANRDEWDRVEADIARGRVDLLLISPERLANEKFRSEVLPEIGRHIGLLVVDEAHCISDWGHDFRPDYRKIVRVLDLLPRGVPVLCCTATANDRVVEDVMDQLGPGLVALRGPLGREGLRLHVLRMPSQRERLAWLSEVIPRLQGTGVVYCLTIRDTMRVSSWLQSRGIDAVAYSGGTDREERLAIEEDLLANRRKVVVATSALGMGFDKPDLAFVIHYQSPGSPITYYQQVGRAGRKMGRSWGILLNGSEDREIQDYFIERAFPPSDLVTRVVSLLGDRAAPMSSTELLGIVNVRRGQLNQLLKVLEVEGAVEREGSCWQRTLRPWVYDRDRLQGVTALRRVEQRQMQNYISSDKCRMGLLRRYLDDVSSGPCGICDICSGDPLPIHLDPEELEGAEGHLRTVEHPIEPRKRIPGGGNINPERRLGVGRALSVWGDGGWSDLVRRGKQVDGRFDDRLVTAAAQLIRQTPWCDGSPEWLTFVPSLRNPDLVTHFAIRLAASLGLACEDVVIKVGETHPQKSMQNSEQQYANIRGAFTIRSTVHGGPVLLVDDIVDSRWTMTAIGWLLREAGSGPVYPFALADTAGRSV